MQNSTKLFRQHPRIFFLSLFSLGTILGIYFFLNHIIFTKALRKSENQFNQNQYLQTRIAAQGIKEVLKGIERSVTILSSYSLVEFLEGKRSASSLENLFGIQLQEHNYLRAYAFFPAPGTSRLFQKSGSSAGDRSLDLAREWSITYWKDDSSSSSEKGPFFLPPYLQKEEQYLGILHAVRTGGVFRGILLAVLDLHRLSLDYITPLRSGEYGAGFLLSGKGDVLYDHEVDIIGKNIFDGLHRAFPELLKLDERLVTEPSGKAEYTFFLARGKKETRKLIAWHEVNVGNLHLVVALSAPDMEIEVALRETRLFQFLSTTFLLLFVGGCVFFFSRWNASQDIRENEERLKLALQGNQDGLWDYNPLTGHSFYSLRWKEMLGYTEKEIPHRFEEWFSRIHPEDRERTLEDFQKHLKEETPSYENEHRLLCKNGTYKWIHTRGMVLERTSQGTPKRMLGTHTDIDSRKRNESELHRFSLAVEQSPSAILITDMEGTILYVNKSFERITGYSRQEVLGKNPRILKSGKQDPQMYRELWQTIREGREWRGEMVNRCKNGSEIWVRISISPVIDETGTITSYVGIQEDITDLKNKEKDLEILATTDELTGLHNRRRFMNYAKEEQKRCKRYGHSMGLVMFDIDHFKNINDTYGHDAGDLVLQKLALLARENLRETDIVGRLGGEEFGILLIETNMPSAFMVIERLRKTLENSTFTINEKLLNITASFGIAFCSKEFPAETVDSLLKEADQAMYHAKENGRNKVAFFRREAKRAEIINAMSEESQSGFRNNVSPEV